ncbi:MAG: hypothetical protein QF733_09870 [Phycisphaerales bacterium]|jgi:hypothetical protein|nr:hypothetical protein [Phycisphaerales bacterium]
MTTIHTTVTPHWARLASMIVLAVPALLPEAAHADERRFTFLRTATTHAKGTVEFEHWTTVKWDRPGDSYDGYWRLDFREEIEVGLTDHFQLAFYVADWRVKHTDDTGTKTEFRNSALELKWNLTDPTTDLVGIGAYLEGKFGDEKLAAEGKLLVQKNIDQLQLLYNLTLEGEWEDENYTEAKGKIKNQFGASWQLTENLFAGAELLVDTTLPRWRTSDATTGIYLGPAVAWHGKGWFIAGTLEFLVNRGSYDGDGMMFRTIVGIDF